MASKVRELEDRVARLEKELDTLKATVTGGNKLPWWKEIEGVFEGDPVFAEIVRLGAKIRRPDRKGPK
jgi:hypothetical protein